MRVFPINQFQLAEVKAKLQSVDQMSNQWCSSDISLGKGRQQNDKVRNTAVAMGTGVTIEANITLISYPRPLIENSLRCNLIAGRRSQDDEHAIDSFNNGAGIVAVLVLLLLLVVGVVVSLKASNEGIAQLVGHVGGQSEEQSGLFFV